MRGGGLILVDSPTLAHLLLATAFVYERAATTKFIFIYEIQAFRPGQLTKKFYILCYSLIGDDCILFTLQGSKILMTEADLNGTWRVAVDGMATEKECQMLIKLAEVCSLFLLNVHG